MGADLVSRLGAMHKFQSLWFGYAGTFLQSDPRNLAESVRNEEVAAALSSMLAAA